MIHELKYMEPKYSVEVQPHFQNFTSRLRLFDTACIKI